jgi:hypothetical protein
MSNDTKQVWIVRAIDYSSDTFSCEFEMVFSTRIKANAVYEYGEKTLPELRWSCQMTPLDAFQQAEFEIGQLKEGISREDQYLIERAARMDDLFLEVYSDGQVGHKEARQTNGLEGRPSK